MNTRAMAVVILLFWWCPIIPILIIIAEVYRDKSQDEYKKTHSDLPEKGKLDPYGIPWG
jgi:hypothetical protein